MISFYAASRNGPCLFLLLQSFFLTPFLFYLNFSSLSQNILVFFFFHTQCSFTMRACTRGHHIHHARTHAHGLASRVQPSSRQLSRACKLLQDTSLPFRHRRTASQNPCSAMHNLHQPKQHTVINGFHSKTVSRICYVDGLKT